MYAAVYIALVLSVLAAPAALLVARCMAPDVAAKFLCATALTASACLAWGLALLSGAALGPELRALWVSRSGAAVSVPVPDWVSSVAGIALLVAAYRVARFWERRAALLRETNACLPESEVSNLVIIDDPAPQAFAVSGASPRVIVTSGMLQALKPLEQRALLAHERAHLAHHHHRYQTLTRVASIVNPAVTVVTRRATYALERWADEDAAAVIGDRPAVATSLARVALLTNEVPGSVSLAYANLGVVDRVSAMRAEKPPRRSLLGLGSFLLVAIPATVAVMDATLSLARILDAGAIIHR